MDQQEFNFDVVTFNRQAGEARKDQGMSQAASSRAELLEWARAIAVWVASGRPARTCSADDVMHVLIDHGYNPEDLGNAAGSLFPRSQWEFTGAWEKSRRVSNHAHMNRIWKLRDRG